MSWRDLPLTEEEYFDLVREEQSFPMSIADEDREFASRKGAEHPEQAWILSDRDVWYANPAYTGPRVPHPEDYESEA
jgi:hypothetical protein